MPLMCYGSDVEQYVSNSLMLFNASIARNTRKLHQRNRHC